MRRKIGLKGNPFIRPYPETSAQVHCLFYVL